MADLTYKNMPPMEVIKEHKDIMAIYPDAKMGVIADSLCAYAHGKELKKEELNFFVKTLCQTNDTARILDVIKHFKNLSENNMTKLLSAYLQNSHNETYINLLRELQKGKAENLKLANKVMFDIKGETLFDLTEQEINAKENKENEIKAQAVYLEAQNKCKDEKYISSADEINSWIKILCKSDIKKSTHQFINFACETKGLTQANIHSLMSALIKINDEEAIKYLKINMLSNEAVTNNTIMIFDEFEKLTGRKLYEENIEFPDEKNLFSFN